ncbi:RES family NAD+ phosphorylase [Duganella violaceipulchra]|uniref:RES domain-containing protein n=1 Tax=Duganella violaceipulchra TaxID=2849652 RepID=A0AA41KZI4_9BURK|nr:RES family NAD+ phosphorylase [Duganella violaceicalia]MBV6320531.1 RES family NAD+ phosphorylase [Duganella violaceicalia]MCP2008761.1 RES domain-containing protein [Duganella violaceicalia]
MTVSLWRIASDTTAWTADDMSGKGAANRGARWNQAGEHVAYAATSISLAAWETRAHFGAVLVVPSVIINEEDNVLINPTHPDAARIAVARIRQFLYDPRV